MRIVLEIHGLSRIKQNPELTFYLSFSKRHISQHASCNIFSDVNWTDDVSYNGHLGRLVDDIVETGFLERFPRAMLRSATGY